MASPQKENGFTPIANEILEKLVSFGLNGTELSVVFFILRKTYGFQKKQDEISISQFLLAIPASRQTLCTALKKLQLVKIIRLVKKGNSKICSNLWTFNKDYDTWQLVKKYRLVKKSISTSQVFHKQLVKKPRHTKETIQKKETKESMSSKADEKYFFKECLEKMFLSTDKRMIIIAWYWTYKKIEFENKDNYSAGIRRELRPSGNLKGYDIERIKQIMYFLNGQSDWMDWTLETVSKYIDKDINKLNEQYADRTKK